MGKFLPIRVTVNDDKEKVVNVENKDGRVWIRVGYKQDGIDICITQSEGGLGLIVDAYDSKTCEQHLGTMTIWYDDINQEQDEVD